MAPSKIPTDSPSSSPTAFYLGCWTDNASRELTILLRANFNLVDCVDRCGAIGYAYAGMQVGVSFCLSYCSYYAVVAFDSRSSRSVVSMNAIVEILMGVSVHRPHAHRLVPMDPNVAAHGRTASIGPIHRIQ
jgi:SNF family Na+-dependent transporter